jgi:hypothetical protein
MSVYINRVQPTTTDEVLRVAMEKGDTTFITLYTHNWCDKTTWYQESTRVVSGVATDTGDHQTYELDHNYIIDTYHGKLTGEDFLTDDDGYSYLVNVWVDGELQTEEDPDTCSGDYSINYPSGIIEFNETLSAEQEVTATYHYAGSSLFTVQAAAGKTLKVGTVEVQMTEDIDITDTLTFTMYGLVDVFAPQYLIENGGPYPSGTKIPLANSLTFKTITDYYNDAIKAFPAYPPLGGSGWRGMNQNLYVMDWDYVRNRVLYGNYGMEIRMKMENDRETGGTYTTATFYATTEDHA